MGLTAPEAGRAPTIQASRGTSEPTDGLCLPDGSNVGPSHRSSALEKVLEYRFLADLTAQLWRRGAQFEVLRGDVDNGGHDLVIEANGVLRHIQLKAMIKGGKRADVAINTSLARKSSGCVVWMTYDPATLALGPFRWLGGAPGEPLPELGDRVAKHSKGNALGEKTVRPAHRVVPRGRFEKIVTIAELADRLFGPVMELAS
jgi:hypothetical protein